MRILSCLLLTRLLRSIKSINETGNVALLFGLAVVPLIVFAGGAVDYSRSVLVQKSIQAALDSAVLAGVSSSHSAEEQIVVANAYFEANRDANVAAGEVLFHREGAVLIGAATSNVQTSFLKLISMPTLGVSAKASATAERYRVEVCVMAMHPNRKHTLELSGSVDVIGPSCHFYGNSTHPDDVVDPHNIDNYLTGKSVQANGYGHHYLENVTPPLEHAPEVLSDPLESRSIPSAPGCAFTAKTVVGETVTLTPGNYCEGLEISSSAEVTLSPGRYFIEDGNFIVEDSTVTGTGVTVVLVDDGSAIEWKNSTIRMTAPTSGPEAGFVLMGQRSDASNSIHASTVDLEGVVYLPKGAFTWFNTGTPEITAKWTAWIVDGFSWDGAGVINMNFDYEHGVPYPDELRRVIPRPGAPRLLL